MTGHLLFQEGHSARKCRLATLKLPWETANRQATVLQFRRANIAAHVLNMHTVVRKERIVRQLIRAVRKECIDLICAKFLFTLCAYLLPLFQRASTQEATDRQVHRVVCGD